MNATQDKQIDIVYDGQCPFCNNYVHLLRLKAMFEKVNIHNARELNEDIANEIAQLNLNLDEGMAVKYQSKWYYASDAMHLLAAISEPKGLFNTLNHYSLKHRGVARFVYPIFKAIRNFTLRLMGRKKINVEEHDNNA